MRTQLKPGHCDPSSSAGTLPRPADGSQTEAQEAPPLSAKERKKRHDAAIDQWASTVNFVWNADKILKRALNPPRYMNFLRREDRTTLDLHAKAPTSLPPEIGDIEGLKKLKLGSNWLTVLPKEIAKLSELQDLDLRSNRLQDLPREFSNLTSLRHLNLTENAFTRFPAAVLALPTQCQVDLRDNPLTEHEIVTARARVLQRSESRQCVPRLRLPPIAADVGTLREATEYSGPNADFPVLYLAAWERLDRVVSAHADQSRGMPIARTVLSDISAGAVLVELRALKKQGPEAKKLSALAMEGYERATFDRSYAGSTNDCGYFFAGRHDSSGFAINGEQLLRFVAFDLDAQVKRTLPAYRDEAKKNALALIVDALADGPNECRIGKCEALIQLTGLPLSRYAERFPEIIGTAWIPHTRQQVNGLIFDVAKRNFAFAYRRELAPGKSTTNRLPPEGWRRGLENAVRERHPWISPEHLDEGIRRIESEWPTFRALVQEQHGTPA